MALRPTPEMTARYEGQVQQYAALYEGLGKYRSLDVSDHAQLPGVGSGTANQVNKEVSRGKWGSESVFTTSNEEEIEMKRHFVTG